MLATVFYFAFFLAVPLGIVTLVRHVPIATKLGAIVLCYATGILIGVSGLVPDSAYAPRKTLSEVSLVFALPLLLFSIDLSAWGRIAGKALVSMLCAVVAVSSVATLLFFWMDARGVSQAEHFSAMAVGMYTGGVANLAAMQLALSIPEDRFTLFATVDTAVGAMYLLFMLTFATRVFGTFLKPFAASDHGSLGKTSDKKTMPAPQISLRPMLVALIAAAICVGLSLAIAPRLSFMQLEVSIIVLLTTFGLLASFIPAVRNNKLAEPLGMFLIYVFTFCIAASLDLNDLIGADWTVVVFILLATVGTVALHALFCRLGGVDVETFAVTSVAAVLSPAFVPMIVQRLANPALMMSGIAVGILGFAIGNYLGISLALILAQ